jgi:hypothetical protein
MKLIAAKIEKDVLDVMIRRVLELRVVVEANPQNEPAARLWALSREALALSLAARDRRRDRP